MNYLSILFTFGDKLFFYCKNYIIIMLQSQNIAQISTIKNIPKLKQYEQINQTQGRLKFQFKIFPKEQSIKNDQSDFMSCQPNHKQTQMEMAESKKLLSQTKILRLFKRLKHLKHIVIPKSYQQLNGNQNSINVFRCQFIVEHGQQITILDNSQKVDPLLYIYYFIINISKAIMELEKYKIIHFDIKLKNIVMFKHQKTGEIVLKFIDFGEALVFNQEEEFEQLRSASEEYACYMKANFIMFQQQIVNLIKEKKNKELFDYYKKQYKNLHSRQFQQLLQQLMQYYKNNSWYPQIEEKIKKLILNQSYKQLISYCYKQIYLKKKNKSQAFFNLFEISWFNQQGQEVQISSIIESAQRVQGQISQQYKKQSHNYPLSYDQSTNTIQQSQLNKDNKIQSQGNTYNDRQIDKLISKQDINLDGKLCPQCKKMFEQKAKQCSNLSKLKQNISKVCSQEKCIQINSCLLCPCKYMHNKSEKESGTHILLDLINLLQKTPTFDQKINKWEKTNYYALVQKLNSKQQYFQKIQQYYQQIMGDVIDSIFSLKDELDPNLTIKNFLQNHNQKNSNLRRLKAFSNCPSQAHLDQFIEYASNKIETSFCKISQFLKIQLKTLKAELQEALKFKLYNNPAKAYLDQKYKTVQNSQRNLLGEYQRNNTENSIICTTPLSEIKKIHYPRIQNLTVIGQKFFDQQVMDNMRQEKIKNHPQGQVLIKTKYQIQHKYRMQLTECKILRFVNQQNFSHLKTLHIQQNQSGWSHPRYQIKAIKLLELISKTRLKEIILKGVKVVQFQQALEIYYKVKQPSINQQQLLPQHKWMINFKPSEELQMQIDAEILFNLKFSKICEKKQKNLLYFLNYIKQLKSINLIYELKSNQLDERIILETIKGSSKLKDIKISINSFKAADQKQNIIFLQKLLLISNQNTDKISGLTLEKIQFAQKQSNGQADSNQIAKYWQQLINIFKSESLQFNFALVNCKNIPTINLESSQISNLIIQKTSTVNVHPPQKQQQVHPPQKQQQVHPPQKYQQGLKKLEKMKSMWISNQQYLFKCNFNNLKILKISLTEKLINSCQKRSISLPNLIILILQKEVAANLQGKQLLFPRILLQQLPKLQELTIKNISLSSNFLQFLKSNFLKKLHTTGCLFIKGKQQQNQLVDIFQKKLSNISQLSLEKIDKNVKDSNNDRFFDFLIKSQKLQKLVLDTSIVEPHQKLIPILNKNVQVIIKQKTKTRLYSK